MQRERNSILPPWCPENLCIIYPKFSTWCWNVIVQTSPFPTSSWAGKPEMAAAPSLHCISAYLHFWKRPFWGELGSLNVDTVYKYTSAVCLQKPSRQSATESCLSCPATPGGCSEKSYFPFPFPLPSLAAGLFWGSGAVTKSPAWAARGRGSSPETDLTRPISPAAARWRQTFPSSWRGSQTLSICSPEGFFFSACCCCCWFIVGEGGGSFASWLPSRRPRLSPHVPPNAFPLETGYFVGGSSSALRTRTPLPPPPPP